MKPKAVALVERSGTSRTRIARYLRDAGYEVLECEELSIVTRFVGVVLVDDHDDEGELARSRVQSWAKSSKPLRVVVISSKPTRWRTLSLALGDQLFVIAAPSFGWEIVDALRMTPPGLPGRV